MRFSWRATLSLLLAFAVLAILISPLVPSPPTALRATRAAHAFHSAIAVIVTAVADRLVFPSLEALTASAAPSARTGRDILDQTVARLC